MVVADQAWLVLFGAFLFGETFIIPAAALAAQGAVSPLEVAGWAFLGTVLADLLWFLVAGRADRYLCTHEHSRRRYRKVVAWLDRRCGARPERALLFIKFVYGARLATIVYLSRRGLALRRFVAFTAAGTALWMTVIVGLGWFAGKGLDAWMPGLVTAQRLFPVILFLALALKGKATWLSRSALPKK